MRKKVVAPHDQEWVGKKVRYSPSPGVYEYGRVKRMATGKAKACFVWFDGHSEPKLCYCQDLEVVNDF